MRTPRHCRGRCTTRRMKPGVGERKWEIDSLCYPIRLAHGYWRATGDTAPFDEDWRAAMHLVLATFRQQQRLHGPGPYRYHRPSDKPSESLARDGLGAATRPNGMIHAAFRPSDDACTYPLNVPGNLFAVVALRQLAAMSRAIHRDHAFAGAMHGAGAGSGDRHAPRRTHPRRARRHLGLRGRRPRPPAVHGRRQRAQPAGPALAGHLRAPTTRCTGAPAQGRGARPTRTSSTAAPPTASAGRTRDRA